MKNLLMKMTKIHINFNKRNFAVKYPQKKIVIISKSYKLTNQKYDKKWPNHENGIYDFLTFICHSYMIQKTFFVKKL